MFDTAPGKVAVDVVADSLRRSRIQVDVGVLAPDEPGRQCRVLSQETTEVQGHEFPCYLEWVHPVRELLAVKGYAQFSTRTVMSIATRCVLVRSDA